MLNRKTVMALAAAMVMAALYGCSGSDNSGLKNDLEMYKEQVADLTAERDARAMITPEALEALEDALGTMDLTPATLATLVMRADITQGAYDALMAVLPAGMELTVRTLSELAGRAELTQAQYENLMNELPVDMPLNVQNLRMLAGRADITAADYDALMDAMGDMDLDVRTLEDLVGRADITQAQYDLLMAVLPNLNVGTTLQDVVTMAGQYTDLLDALGASGMSHADAVALAMELVGEDTAATAVDVNRIARKIAGLVMADSIPTEVSDITERLVARFGIDVITERKAAITGSGLSIGMLKEPGLQLEGDEVMGEAVMVDAEPPAVTPNDFVGALFNEEQPGGRDLMTYAYTDVKDPWEENFEDAYGRLVVSAPKPDPVDPEVENPGTGIDVTAAQITAYNEYLIAQAVYERALAAYQRDLAEITQDDFTGEPEAGGPSNTPDNMLVVGTETGEQVITEDHFWSLSNIDPAHLPEPAPKPSGAIVDPATPVIAQYQPLVDEPDEETPKPSQLKGQFDGVEGNFVCTTTAELCQISALRTDKKEGDRVRMVVKDGVEYAVEYTFVEADTWKFVATDPTAIVDTMRQDGDYLMIGWWLEVPAISTGDFRFGRFFAGSDPFEDASAVTIDGPNDSARYAGSAVGKYAERDIGTDTARKGLFTATAELEANFEADMIKGTIEGFMDDSGMPRPWHVVLEEVAIETSAFAWNTSGEADGRDWLGTWKGEFYGRGLWPSSVAGLFNATFGCPEMAGPAGGCAPDQGDAPPEEGFAGVSGVFGAHHSGNFAQPTDEENGEL